MNTEMTVQELAEKITESIFYVDPYNGAEPEEMTEANCESLKTLAGCYEIIEELCNILVENM